MSEVNRRQFLKMIGLGTVAGAVAVTGYEGMGAALRLEAEEQIQPAAGVEKWTSTLCGLCAGGCGVQARSIGERIVNLKGNLLHPVNRGGLCPVGLAGLQLLYNPDRLRTPLKRVGKRGSGRWRAIGWDDAIELMRSRLEELRAAKRTETFGILSGGLSELADRTALRFLDAYGSGNFLRQQEAFLSLGQDRTQGIRGRVAYDFENCNYILSFGAPLAEGWMSPVHQMSALAYFHHGRSGHRGKLVQIESRLSPTATKADRWVPIRPGTEGALALGIAHILVRDDLYDHDFVERHLSGFHKPGPPDSTGSRGFRSLVLKDFSPERVSYVTGVPIATISLLAREFAHHRPAVALPRAGLFAGEEARFSTYAVHALNALAGNIDRPGGALVRQDPPLSSWPPVKHETGAARAAHRPRPTDLWTAAVTHDQMRRLVGGLNSLFILGCNPVFSNLPAFRDALSKVSFLVCSTTLLHETAEQADLVLPDCTALERWDLQTGAPGFALNTVGIARPAVAPLHESRPAAEAILTLARALGGHVAASFPWPETKDALKDLVRGLYDARRGVIFTEQFREEYLIPEVRQSHWPAQPHTSFATFWDTITSRGGWVDPSYRYADYRRSIRTPSGKFDLSPLLKSGLPLYETRSRTTNQRYPLNLHLFTPLAMVSDYSANLPFLQEIIGSSDRSAWRSWVEINPDTAEHLDIRNDDSVFVESTTGWIKTRALLNPGAMPEVVSIPLGQGHTALGRWARKHGVSPLVLTGGSAQAKVRVYKA